MLTTSILQPEENTQSRTEAHAITTSHLRSCGSGRENTRNEYGGGSRSEASVNAGLGRSCYELTGRSCNDCVSRKLSIRHRICRELRGDCLRARLVKQVCCRCTQRDAISAAIRPRPREYSQRSRFRRHSVEEVALACVLKHAEGSSSG